jgi:hypothetical protein
MDTLFSNLLDESRRIQVKETTTVLFTKPKKTGSKFCSNCKKPGHDSITCWFLHPEKAPDFWKHPGPKQKPQILHTTLENPVENPVENPRVIRDERIEVLYTKIPNQDSSISEQAETSITSKTTCDRVINNRLWPSEMTDSERWIVEAEYPTFYDELVSEEYFKDRFEETRSNTSDFYEESRPDHVYDRYGFTTFEDPIYDLILDPMDTAGEIDWQVLTLIHTPENHLNNQNIDIKISEKVLNSVVRLQEDWVLDTGATRHIICNKAYFNILQNSNKTVSWGNAKSIKINGVGNVIIQFKDTKRVFYLKDVLYMPELGINIISQSQLNKKITIFNENKFSIYEKLNNNDKSLKLGNKVTEGFEKDGLYYLNLEVIYKNPTLNNITILNTTECNKRNHIWHIRLGHISYNIISKLENTTIGYSSLNTKPIKITHNEDKCEICLKANLKNKINHHINNKPLDYLDKVTSDILGPITPLDLSGYKYLITFLEKSTREIQGELLKTKDEAYNAFIRYKNKVENNNYNIRIKRFKTDKGGEYLNNKFKTLCEKDGIIHEVTPAFTKEPNGLIERPNYTIFSKVRALLLFANLPKYFWGDAALYAIYIYNRIPHTALNFITPYEVKYKAKPNIENIVTFGSICYYKNKGNNITKLDPRGNKGIIVGIIGDNDSDPQT